MPVEVKSKLENDEESASQIQNWNDYFRLIHSRRTEMINFPSVCLKSSTDRLNLVTAVEKAIRVFTLMEKIYTEKRYGILC